MTRPDQDDFDDYLGGETPLSRAYQESAHEQPPAHVDSAIRRAARLTAEERARPPWWSRLFGPPRASSPFGQQWAIPAVAASFVIVATLALLVSGEPDVESTINGADQPLLMPVDADNQPLPAAADPAKDAGRGATTGSSAATGGGVPATPGPAAGEAPAMRFDERDDAAASKEEAKARARAQPEGLTAPPQSLQEAPAAAAPAPAAADNVGARRLPASEVAPAAPDAQTLRKARDALERAERNISSFETRRRNVRAERQVVGKVLSDAPRRAATAATSESTAAGTGSDSGQAAGAVPAADSVAAPASPAADQQRLSPALRPPALRAQGGVDGGASSPFAALRALIEQGRLDDARERLQALLAENPDLRVPDDVREALALP